ncbi:MAG: hypothetical protein KDH97_18040 [Calditrichaeota bacterium]|nr:hypothetical protein [Calditrichota bacterium]MCB0292162.1 hypothetical protein [Calditrichota bacterium]MCB0306151.1 hypothetical protein [Calditrichota bacterium]MCB0314058.1 hypothetical protein [Calditrichota bacterium]MCB9090210.1 hypothetical protein [Calditrichia bacterium]
MYKSLLVSILVLLLIVSGESRAQRYEDGSLLLRTNFLRRNLVQVQNVSAITLDVYVSSRGGFFARHYTLAPGQAFQMEDKYTKRNINDIYIKCVYNDANYQNDLRIIRREIEARNQQQMIMRALFAAFDQFFFDGAISQIMDAAELLEKAAQAGYGQDDDLVNDVAKSLIESGVKSQIIDQVGGETPLARALVAGGLELITASQQYHYPDLEKRSRLALNTLRDVSFNDKHNYSLREAAINLDAFKRQTPLMMVSAGLIGNSYGTDDWQMAKDANGKSDVGVSYKAAVSFFSDHMIFGRGYGNFFISGFYEKGNASSPNTLYVGDAYVGGDDPQALFQAPTTTRLALTQYGGGIAYQVFSRKGGYYGLEVGAAQTRLELKFADKLPGGGTSSAGSKFEIIETASLSPYAKFGAGWSGFRRSKLHLGLGFAIKYTLGNPDYKKGYELYRNTGLDLIELPQNNLTLSAELNLSF